MLLQARRYWVSIPLSFFAFMLVEIDRSYKLKYVEVVRIEEQINQSICQLLIKIIRRLRCDQCAPYQYGFSSEGCKPCDCDGSGSKGFQCDQYGQCPCNDNVEGRRCDRCKENKYDRHQGCLDCPDCYDLVQDAANDHRKKLHDLNQILQEIASKPTVIDDIEFESKLKTVQEKIDILTEDAKSGAGGGDRTLKERIHDLHDRLESVRKILDNLDQLQGTAALEIENATHNVTLAESTIVDARKALSVRSQEMLSSCSVFTCPCLL